MNRQKDLRSEPVGRIAVLGESTAWGYSVSDKSKCFANRLAAALSEFQGQPAELLNQGIGSNVLTRLCPAYERSAKPCALDRVQKEIIDHRPDMVILCYGLNDSRGGTDPETFRREYQKLIDLLRQELNPLLVLVNTYYMHEVLYDHCEGWEESSYELTELYNLVIAQLAEKNRIILADVYAAEQGVDWIIDEDHCHPNDLGHALIANRIFEAVVRNCSFPARTMPKKTLIWEFINKYGNGPDLPSTGIATTDVMTEKTDKENNG